MTKKSAKDILRDMKAESKGISSKDVEFIDLRKKTSKKKKVKKEVKSESELNTIDNNEGLVLTEAGTAFCDYRDIGQKGRLTKKSCLDEWGPFDFFRFAGSLYIKKYKVDWNLQMGGNGLEINRIKDRLLDEFGYICNIILYDYIVYFFEHNLDYFVKKDGFFFSQMKNEWAIAAFKESYNFRNRFIHYMTTKKQNNKKYELTIKEMQKSYDTGDATMVINYGVVISLNWLLKVKKMNKKEAIKIIVDVCRDMYNKHMIDVIQSSTEMYSPYPSNLLFKSPQLIFNKVDDEIIVNVEFNTNSKMKFLQKETKKKGE